MTSVEVRRPFFWRVVVNDDTRQDDLAWFAFFEDVKTYGERYTVRLWVDRILDIEDVFPRGGTVVHSSRNHGQSIDGPRGGCRACCVDLAWRRLSVTIHTRYTLAVKTAISVPDALFDRGEQAAARLGLNRSELYSRALRQFLDTRGPDPVTEAINAAVSVIGDDAELAALLEADAADARRHIESGGWEW